MSGHTSRRIIKGVLHNFLGTFGSRYSNFSGYWLFGFLLDQSDITIDLLTGESGHNDHPPTQVAGQLAAQKFAEQIAKANLAPEYIKTAHAKIMKGAEKKGSVNGRPCSGFDVRLAAFVVSDLGNKYESEMHLFVAPHNSNIELQSAYV